MILVCTPCLEGDKRKTYRANNISRSGLFYYKKCNGLFCGQCGEWQNPKTSDAKQYHNFEEYEQELKKVLIKKTLLGMR
jgi:hypothetical protein